MPPDIDPTFTVSLPPALAADVRRMAAERGWTPESLIADCVAQSLEIALRHRVLVERLERVDAAILEMAEAVGELGAPSGSIDLSKVCRYAAATDEADADPTA